MQKDCDIICLLTKPHKIKINQAYLLQIAEILECTEFFSVYMENTEEEKFLELGIYVTSSVVKPIHFDPDPGSQDGS